MFVGIAWNIRVEFLIAMCFRAGADVVSCDFVLKLARDYVSSTVF